ncbi:MAG: hypothetical protein P9L96_05650 [Candidatus Gygaella obscura]|nr:hypothetical protein [Candidatus Gygaella obscura]
MDRQKLARIFLNTLKLILGLLILPFVISVTIVFIKYISQIEKVALSYFINGMVFFLVLYLFVYEPRFFYKKGQHFLEVVFRFFAPLVKTAPYVLPIYVIIFGLLHFVLRLFSDSVYILYYSLFLCSFSLIMHLSFSARILRPKRIEYASIANYIFAISIIYIVNILVFGSILNFMLESFSFSGLFNGSVDLTKAIYSSIFNQLFVS